MEFFEKMSISSIFRRLFSSPLTPQKVEELTSKAKALEDEIRQLYLDGSYSDALQKTKSCVPIYEELRDVGNLGRLHEKIGACYEKLGQPTKALVEYRRAADMLKKANKQELRLELAEVLYKMGRLLVKFQELQEGIKHINESVALYRYFQKYERLSIALFTLLSPLKELGRIPEAHSCAEELLQLQLELGDKGGQAKALNELGLIQSIQRQNQDAINNLKQSAALYRELKKPRWAAIVLRNLGDVYQESGQFQEALETFQEAINSFRKADYQKGLTMATCDIGVLYLVELDNVDKAIKYFQSAMNMSRSQDDLEGVATNLTNLGTAYYKKGQFENALKYCREALEYWKELRNDIRIIQTENRIHEIETEIERH